MLVLEQLKIGQNWSKRFKNRCGTGQKLDKNDQKDS